jgi:hypothetical protein
MDRIGNLGSLNTLSEQALRLRYKADPATGDQAQAERQRAKGTLEVSTSSAGEVRHQRRSSAALNAPAANEARDRPAATRADDTPQRPAQRSEVQNANAQYRRDDRTLLKIRTQEGDVVKLRFAESDAIRMQAKEGADEQALTELQLRSRQDRNFSVMVRGELSESEMAAVRSVIEQVSAVADDFFDNDLAGAFATASSFNVDGSQLARVNLDLRRRESLTYSELGSAPQGALRRDEGAQRGEPVNDRATPLRAADGAGPQARVEAVAAEDAAQAATQAVAGPTEPGATTEPVAPGGSLADALASINQFLQRLMERLDGNGGSQPGAATGSIELGFTFKLQLFESVVFTASQAAEQEREAAEDAEEAEAPRLPDLLSDTLAGLATESRLALNARA